MVAGVGEARERDAAHAGGTTDRERGGDSGALLLLCLAQFVLILDIAIVSVALPAIQADLDFSRGNLQLVVTTYALTFGGLLLLGGRVADLLGRRRVFVAGLVLFTLASLACRTLKRSSSRARITSSSTATTSTTPIATNCQFASTCKRFNPLRMVAIASAPIRAFETPPRPPRKLAPPMITALMASSSAKRPTVGDPASMRPANRTAASPAAAPTSTYTVMSTLSTGIPTLLAASGSPPMA
jgi:hypothetical protein